MLLKSREHISLLSMLEQKWPRREHVKKGYAVKYFLTFYPLQNLKAVLLYSIRAMKYLFIATDVRVLQDRKRGKKLEMK